ncbi:MAG: response regulator transcription factor [Actinomycetaceae bacterium]|nr:response regulator transcription factor [Actinomycetaceae bacterium]MDU0970383.1 response regulator transcription factor [Actinomycetaceae bacterium]
MTTVLIVEDDEAIARALVINLKVRDFEVVVATTAAGALKAAADADPDVVLLDLGLPDMDGLTVIDGIRGWSDVPIIVVSARHEAHSKIEALDRGADDYVTKPFSLGELLARLRANVRRSAAHAAQVSQVVTADGRVNIDLAAHQVTKDGEVVKLTATEWKVLEVLARHANQLVSRTDLLTAVWGPEYVGESTYTRVYLSQLRAKLEDDSHAPAYLVTELGMGYRLVAAPSPTPPQA